MVWKWLVYYKDSNGYREGVEIIEASSREEAKSIYKRYFNVNQECKAIPRIEVENYGSKTKRTV